MNTITLKRKADRIMFLSESGAEVAYLIDGENQIRFDPLADTREAMGEVNYRQIVEEVGLDVATARMIDSMPIPSIGPESLPGAFTNTPEEEW